MSKKHDFTILLLHPIQFASWILSDHFYLIIVNKPHPPTKALLFQNVITFDKLHKNLFLNFLSNYTTPVNSSKIKLVWIK